MKNYEVVLDDNDYSWLVYETHTDQIIKAFFFEDEASEYTQFLNKGGAFDGWTPRFMTTKSLIDINDIFDAEFS
jgi:hypothetical protein